MHKIESVRAGILLNANENLSVNFIGNVILLQLFTMAYDLINGLPKRLKMALQDIHSHKEMLEKLNTKGKSYVLLYKRGSEASDCSFKNLEESISQLRNILVMAADVNLVRDIHTVYQIESAPSLLVFNEGEFEKSIKGCNDNNYYKSLFENALFTAKAKAEGKPQKRITVYTTPTCSWCTTLKTHLKNNGIRYSEIDISRDQKAAEAMVRKSGQQGVPQTDINGTMIIGFDKVKINNLLGIQ